MEGDLWSDAVRVLDSIEDLLDLARQAPLVHRTGRLQLEVVPGLAGRMKGKDLQQRGTFPGVRRAFERFVRFRAGLLEETAEFEVNRRFRRIEHRCADLPVQLGELTLVERLNDRFIDQRVRRTRRASPSRTASWAAMSSSIAGPLLRKGRPRTARYLSS